MKSSIECHQDCLRNSEAGLRRKEEELERHQKDIERHKDRNFVLSYQIDAAIKEKKDGFDPDRYKFKELGL